MDPRTESELMEDVTPGDRGFIADDADDAAVREQLEQDEGESASTEGCD